MNEVEKAVEALIDLAVKSAKSEDALRYSQAALNVAHTKHALAEIVRLT